MQAIVPYAIWAAIIIAALGVVAIAIFSVRGLFYGKVEPVSIGIMAVPVVVFIVLSVIMDTLPLAAMWTVIVMFVLALLARLFSGVRSIFI